MTDLMSCNLYLTRYCDSGLIYFGQTKQGVKQYMTIDRDSWINHFPGLLKLSGEQRQKLHENTAPVGLKPGVRVFGPGAAPQSFLLLIKGVVRVQQVSASGREIVLYRVIAGESCALTTACLMGYERYLAEAIVEEHAEAVAIPRLIFDELIAQSPEFRKFVFTAFSERVTDLFHIIDEILFARIDIRLAEKLLELCDEHNKLEMTHQQLAHELGSVREVISRQLREFQRRNWVESHRGKIILIQPASLQKLADQNH